MNGRTIIRNLEEHIFLLEHLVFTADLYKERYGTIYLGWPVVRYLYIQARVLKIIHCLIGSQ